GIPGSAARRSSQHARQRARADFCGIEGLGRAGTRRVERTRFLAGRRRSRQTSADPVDPRSAVHYFRAGGVDPVAPAFAASSRTVHDPAQRIWRRAEERGLDHLGLETETCAEVGIEELAAGAPVQYDDFAVGRAVRRRLLEMA